VTTAKSGTPVEALTLDAVRRGELTAADVRIHPDTLEHQARVAEDHANPQLAANLRRAAELTELSDAEVLAIYDALRPRRSSRDELLDLAGSLETRGLTLNAALVRQAADVYARRGMLR
jgi:propanediol dehydratase small subunit